ncbi:hypothetical protein [Nocardia sp. NPDC051463]|uniref:hypothetical protein n=1 Tax=Nocardia sp. NPDC051463 TaxID=3154845 RepID=UPI00344BD4AC
MPSMPRFQWLHEAPDWIRDYYRIVLDTELRSANGNSFQAVFDKVMRCIHGNDYHETAALGKLGDRGCDGYLESRATVFACYGPSPYFKLKSAITKLNSDFTRAVECWSQKGQMKEFVFVFNYPGKHADLIQEAKRLGSEGVAVVLWSRLDIVEQFLLMANSARVKYHFGEFPTSAKAIGRSFVTHEATTLPRVEADVFFRMVRAQLSCDKVGFEKLRLRWNKLVFSDGWACFAVCVHTLVCAVVAYVEAGFEPDAIDVEMLRYQSGISEELWEEHGERTWTGALNLIWSASGKLYDEEAEGVGDDYERIMGTLACCQMLVLGFARMLARESGSVETDCLDEIWFSANRIILRDD